MSEFDIFHKKKETKIERLISSFDYELFHKLANPFSKKDDNFLQRMKEVKRMCSPPPITHNKKSNSTSHKKYDSGSVNNLKSFLKKNNDKNDIPTKKNKSNTTSKKIIEFSFKRGNRTKKVKVTDIKYLNILEKMDLRYNKILKGELDKEIISRNYIRKLTNLSKGSQDNMFKTENNFHNNKKIYHSVKVNNHIFNNCIVNNKVIYDIKPLNQLTNKGCCQFPSYTEGNEKNNEEIIFPPKNLKLGKIDKSDTTPKSPFILRDVSSVEKKRKKKLNLNRLYKELPASNHNCLRTFFEGDGSGAARGAKIKFLKTVYPIEIIKPLATQKSYMIAHGDKSEKKMAKNIKRYNSNHYNLDIKNRKNMNEISKMNSLQRRIVDKIQKEFYLLNSKICSKNSFDKTEVDDFGNSNEDEKR